MILVIEGTEGAGKTTLAKRLSAEFGWPIYRALRGSDDRRWTKEALKSWESIGIRANSYHEDIFSADLLCKLQQSQDVNVILDRSIISGIVYDPTLSARQRAALLDEWSERMRRAGACLLVLAVQNLVAESRLSDPTRARGAAERLVKIEELAIQSGLGWRFIDTTNSTLDEVYQMTVGWMNAIR